MYEYPNYSRNIEDGVYKIVVLGFKKLRHFSAAEHRTHACACVCIYICIYFESTSFERSFSTATFRLTVADGRSETSHLPGSRSPPTVRGNRSAGVSPRGLRRTGPSGRSGSLLSDKRCSYKENNKFPQLLVLLAEEVSNAVIEGAMPMHGWKTSARNPWVLLPAG